MDKPFPKPRSNAQQFGTEQELALPQRGAVAAPKGRAKVGVRGPQITVMESRRKPTAKGQAFIMSNLQAPGSITIEDAVRQFGPAPGARFLMDREQDAAEWSLESGIYGVWRCQTRPVEAPTKENPHALDFCSRIGPKCKCFCGHFFADHDKNPCARKGASTKCHTCECKRFEFVPMRPEEVGDWWLPRRKDFNVTKWRAKCKCGHTHEEHSPGVSKFCKKCGCGQWQAHYNCPNCERMGGDHETEWETRDERKQKGFKIDQAYFPLSSTPELQGLVFNPEGEAEQEQ
ncbi:MAG: hypothetical protein EZS28_004353 [Streblomastix strix]|uniref:Uncharacterized protein n=1 Tax=Streblomastix strix TaxID=222440 RepID=A0A5J4WYD4_9EUKA|nr:MAG: hypothetical protein EZS28_004353 [Streblomastix strix]